MEVPCVAWSLIALSIVWFPGCGGSDRVTTEAPFDFDSAEERIDAFCGACHVTPKPELFPASVWVREVEGGFALYAESGRTDLEPPPIHEVVEYYRSRAPTEFEFEKYELDAAAPVAWQRIESDGPAERASTTPAISGIYLDNSTPATAVYGDMRSGEIVEVQFDDGQPSAKVIGQVGHPAGIHPVDLNQDGQRDWIVADLGNFLPAKDHLDGAIQWLRNEGDRYTTIQLPGIRSRVADVRGGDFDGDGDADLVVAEFGWRRTGSLYVLKQIEIVDGVPQFEPVMIQQRHGAIHTPVIDANGDGLLDFIALFSQEYESVELYLNRGDMQFERQVLFEAGAPSYGCSGMDLVDLDLDGDIDILLANGDAFDSTEVRPYHQIQWLENDGDWNMRHHSITPMPGAHRALPADVDGDGDLDLLAVALLPEHLENDETHADLAATVLMEQTEPGVFQRHELEGGPCRRAALAVGDLNGDTRPDFVTVEFQFSEAGERFPDLTVWINLGAEQASMRHSRPERLVIDD